MPGAGAQPMPTMAEGSELERWLRTTGREYSGYCVSLAGLLPPNSHRPPQQHLPSLPASLSSQVLPSAGVVSPQKTKGPQSQQPCPRVDGGAQGFGTEAPRQALGPHL